MRKMRDVIGKNIMEMRKLQGFTQQDIASYIGVTREQISNYERGEREISVTALNKLADLFGVELSDLFEEDAQMKNLNLAFAFRSENTEEDLEQIASFKKVVLNYLKMERINAN